MRLTSRVVELDVESICQDMSTRLLRRILPNLDPHTRKAHQHQHGCLDAAEEKEGLDCDDCGAWKLYTLLRIVWYVIGGLRGGDEKVRMVSRGMRLMVYRSIA